MGDLRTNINRHKITQLYSHAFTHSVLQNIVKFTVITIYCKYFDSDLCKTCTNSKFKYEIVF